MNASKNLDPAQVLSELRKLAHSLLSIEEFPDIRKLLEKIAESAKEVLKADLIEFYEYRQDQNKYELPQIAAGERLNKAVPKVKIYEDDAVWKLIHRTEPLYEDDAQAESILTAPYAVDRKEVPKERFVVREKIRSIAAIPLRTGNESMGLMFANYRSPQKFPREQRELIELFASQAAIAIKNVRLYYDVNQRREALTELNKLAYSLLSIEEFPDIRKLLEKIAESAKEVLRADLIEFYEYRQDQNKYELPQIAAGERLNKAVPKVKIYEDDAVWKLIQRTEPLYEDEAQAESILTAPYAVDRKEVPKERFVVREKILSTAAIPLRTGNESMGLMFANYRSPQKFTKEQRELIELFASQAAIAIKNVRLYYDVNQRREALTELNKLAHNLVSIEQFPDIRKLLEKIAESAKEVLRADLIEFYEYRQDQNKYELPQIAAGERLDKAVPKVKIYEDDAVWKLIQRTEPLYDEDAQAENILTAPYAVDRKEVPKQRFVVREKILSTAAIPLRTGNESMGLMFANYRSPQKFTKEQRELIELFASQAAIAIKNVRLYYYVNQRREALVEIGQKLTAGIRLRETDVLKLIYDQTSNMLGMENLSIALYDEATDTIRFALASVDGRRVDVDKEPGWEPRQGGNGKTERIIREKKYLLLSTREEVKKTEFSPIPGHKNYESKIADSWLGVPMIVGNKVLGVIATYHHGQEKFYIEDDVKILQALAAQAAIAIDNARLYYEVNRRNYEINRRQKALVSFGRQLSSKILQGETEILNFIHEQAKQFMDTDNMYIALYDDSTDTVRFGLAYKYAERIKVEPRKAGKGRTEEIIRTGSPIFIATRGESVDWYKQPGREEYIGDPLASWIGVPMKAREKVIGVVATYHPTRDFVYSEEDLDILQSMADLAAIALENARLIETEKWAYLGRIAGSIAHRIGNKGGMVRLSVLDLAEYLKEMKFIDKKVTDELNTIARNTEYLLELSDYLFRPQKAVKEGLEKTDVVLYLKDALRYAEIPEDITVVHNDTNHLPHVLGNKYLVEVFLELIVNAVEAMSSSAEKKLIISAKQKEKRVEIQFEDTGPGIAPEAEKLIFELFSHSTDRRLSQKGHQGFGLWWVRTFLTDIGGEIRYERIPQKGAIFIVELPLAE